MTILTGFIFLLLALFGTPLFIIIGALTLLLYFNSPDYTALDVFIELNRMASSPTLLAIPLFTFAGYLLAESKAPQRIVNLSYAAIGWLPGGLAIVSLIACAFFTAFTGASGVTIIALGGLLYPVLLKEKYPENFSLGLLTSSGSLGLLFPPSLAIILYGMVSQTSIDDLFLAGLLPGILLIAMLSVYSIYKGRGRVLEEKREFSWRKLGKALKDSAWEIPMPFIILFGIYGGKFTATEAAAVIAFYVLIVELVVHRDLHITRDIPRIMKESMVLVGSILIILAVALALTEYMTFMDIPLRILDFMQQYVTSKIMFLIVLNIFLLIVGCLMDIFSAIFVVVPLILPIALEFGVDPVHLGIIFLTNLEIGYSTPPVGLNLFIASFRFEQPIFRLYRAAVPFLIILVIALLIITYVPSISLVLVNLFSS